MGACGPGWGTGWHPPPPAARPRRHRPIRRRTPHERQHERRRGRVRRRLRARGHAVLGRGVQSCQSPTRSAFAPARSARARRLRYAPRVPGAPGSERRRRPTGAGWAEARPACSTRRGGGRGASARMSQPPRAPSPSTIGAIAPGSAGVPPARVGRPCTRRAGATFGLPGTSPGQRHQTENARMSRDSGRRRQKTCVAAPPSWIVGAPTRPGASLPGFAALPARAAHRPVIPAPAPAPAAAATAAPRALPARRAPPRACRRPTPLHSLRLAVTAAAWFVERDPHGELPRPHRPGGGRGEPPVAGKARGVGRAGIRLRARHRRAARRREHHRHRGRGEGRPAQARRRGGAAPGAARRGGHAAELLAPGAGAPARGRGPRPARHPRRAQPGGRHRVAQPDLHLRHAARKRSAGSRCERLLRGRGGAPQVRGGVVPRCDAPASAAQEEDEDGGGSARDARHHDDAGRDQPAATTGTKPA